MPRTPAWILLWPLALAAQPLAPEVVLLAGIKQHMAGVLSRQPNYTCQETIEIGRAHV